MAAFSQLEIRGALAGMLCLAGDGSRLAPGVGEIQKLNLQMAKDNPRRTKHSDLPVDRSDEFECPQGYALAPDSIGAQFGRRWRLRDHGHPRCSELLDLQINRFADKLVELLFGYSPVNVLIHFASLRFYMIARYSAWRIH